MVTDNLNRSPGATSVNLDIHLNNIEEELGSIEKQLMRPVTSEQRIVLNGRLSLASQAISYFEQHFVLTREQHVKVSALEGMISSLSRNENLTNSAPQPSSHNANLTL